MMLKLYFRWGYLDIKRFDIQQIDSEEYNKTIGIKINKNVIIDPKLKSLIILPFLDFLSIINTKLNINPTFQNLDYYYFQDQHHKQMKSIQDYL